MSRPRTLAVGRRGRVPFALLGVLLLVGSGTVLLSADTERPAPAAVPTAVERVDAETTATLSSAVRSAARAAAREPVLSPAATAGGRVLNDSTPFRDALRVRIAVAARRGLVTVRTRVGPATARATLPPIESAADLRRAKRSVAVEGENGTLRATVENVTVVVRRDGRVVDRRTRAVTVTVAAPVLTLHERVERFERQANRGPTAGPGLGRRLTASLYALAWGRGYAQYSGLPVENVIGTRHVELATNGGLLATQRAVLGRVDPTARGAYFRAAAHVGVRDLATGELTRSKAWLDTVLGGRFGSAAVPMVLPGGRPPGGGPGPAAPTTVGVNDTADRALQRSLAPGDATVDGRASDVPTVADAVRAVYGARVRVVTRVATERGREPSRTAPGPNWTLVDSERQRTRSVGDASAPVPPAPAGSHVLATRGRRVTVRHVRTDRWRRGNRTRTTVARWRTVHRVGLAVVGDHAPSAVAPDRPIRAVHGGEGGGGALAGITARAVTRTLRAAGGADALARRAVRGDPNTTWRRLDVRVPQPVRERALAAVLALHRRVANVTVTVERGRLATDAAPARALASALRENRSRLLDVPARYDGLDETAVVAARAAYLDRVLALLSARQDRLGATQRGLRDALATVAPDAGLDPTGILTAVGRATRGTGRAVRVGPTARRPLSVQVAPAYLTTATVDSGRVPAADGEFVPLATRNRNLFTAPYTDVARGVVSGVVDGREGRVSLRTGARTLRAAERAPAGTADPETVERLRSAVRTGLRAATDRTAARLAATTPLSRSAAEAVVDDGLDRWRSPAARALALANGSAVEPITERAVERAGLAPGGDADDPRRALRRELLADRVAAAVEAGVQAGGARRPAGAVATVGATVREYAHAAVTEEVAAQVGTAADRLGDRATDRLAERFDDVDDGLPSVPAGLPVTPVPGSWYATANVWHVEARGRYARFAVAAPVGDPAAPGGVVRYVRDGSAVRLDWDGDGRAERLGRSDRVGFAVETAVVVVVPPGPEGVGDRDGVATEDSPGWPTPGRVGDSENRTVE